MDTASENRLSRGDRGALVGFIVAGILIAAWMAVASIRRIVELVRGTEGLV